MSTSSRLLANDKNRANRNVIKIIHGEIHIPVTTPPARTLNMGELAAIERQGIIDRLNSGRELYIQKGGRLGRKPGSRKTAEQRKEEYREAIALLKKGYSIRNVAKLTGKAVSTIQQVKKDFINS